MKNTTRILMLAATLFTSIGYSHELAWHKVFRDRSVTLIFYAKSFEATDILHLKVLRARLEAGRLLERSVLLDMKGESSAETLKQALGKLVESRGAMDELFKKIDELKAINSTNEAMPEFDVALKKILKDHPAVERVSLTDSRFSNVARGKPQPNNKRLGKSMEEILTDIQKDLSLLEGQLDQTIEAFRSVLPVAEKGGFATMMLSGRAPLPEKIMQSANMMLVFTQFYDRSCQTTIAADMQVYPKGLEWLKPASKTWTPTKQ